MTALHKQTGLKLTTDYNIAHGSSGETNPSLIQGHNRVHVGYLSLICTILTPNC